jgi:hypothetical protein
MFPELPIELYEGILTPLCVDWEGKTPNITKALRPNKRLYHEALKIFFRYNTYIFHRESFQLEFRRYDEGCGDND